MITRFSRFVCGLAFCALSASAANITEPVSVTQYDDSVVVYLHGFDLYPDLSLECRLLGADGTVADLRTMNLGERWETPAITMRTGAMEYSGVVVSASSRGTVYFCRFYPLDTFDPQTLVTTAADAFVDPGQFLANTPTIPLPDMTTLATATLSNTVQSIALDSVTLDVKSDVNFPLVSAGNNGALSRQTDFPDDETKISLYVALKAQLYDANDDPGEQRHMLCEIPLDPDWLNGTEDREIKVNYDAIGHMLLDPAKYAEILDNMGGPSLAPAYMAIPLPGQDGQVLGAAEYGYQLARNDTNTPRPGEIDKTYLLADTADPSLELPVVAKIGPYAQQWVDLDGDEWLYIGGYIGLTRFQYSDAGVPRQRFTVDKFGASLANVVFDSGGAGAIKRYRYLLHGLDDRIFLTGTHTAERAGTAYSGGLRSFEPSQRDTLWRLSYMSRGYHTTRMRPRVSREIDGTPVQEFVMVGSYEVDYEPTIPAEDIPANKDAKFFQFEYSDGQMRDRMGVSIPSWAGDVAYSQDRRFQILRLGNDLVTFDPQTSRFIDGKTLSFGDRLFFYGAASDTATEATFFELQVSPLGELSVTPYLTLQATDADTLAETFGVVHTYLPDLANNDGSADLFLGRNLSHPGTNCRLIEDFIPPRSHAPDRSLNLLSNHPGATITGSKPGAAPYRASCTHGESISITATAPDDFTFQEWQDETGASVSSSDTIQLQMDEDRVLTAVFAETIEPPVAELIITDPVSVAQYDDAMVVYMHGFALALTRYPALELKVQKILADGTPGDTQTLGLTEPWEKPSIILRKDGREYAGVVVSASSGADVFFRRLYSFSGSLDPQTQLATTADNSAIELGQFMTEAPQIPLPDLAAISDVLIGPASRSQDLDASVRKVISSINYPLVSAVNLAALTRQTAFPSAPTKRSIASTTFSASNDVEFTAIVNLDVSGNDLSRQHGRGWTASAISVGTLKEDGYL